MDRWLDRFLPDPSDLPDEDARQRARLLAAFNICLTPLGILFSVGYSLFGDIGRGVVIGIFTLLSMSALPLLRRKGLLWAAHWWHTVFFIALVGFSAYNGIASASSAWMGLLVVVITLVGGIKAGVLWGVLVAVSTIVLNMLQYQGIIPAASWGPHVALFSDSFGYMGFFFGCLGLGVLSEWAFRQLAEARDDARAASEAKSRFLATVSHEIRTPLNGILGLAELLEGTPLSDDQRDLLRTLQSSSRALGDIIGDILDFSKIEAGRMELERLPTAPKQLVGDVVALFDPSAVRKGLSLRGEVSPVLPDRIWSDPTRLRQILTNFVSNAVKFTDRGEIVVRARFDGTSRWCLEVEDTGPGVSAAQQESLFEPFTQAESSTTRRFGGTGLGLAICRHLTILMGGKLGVESDGASGSRFWVTLPLDAAPRTAPPADAPPDARVLLRGHILLVEDNPINQLVATRMLKALGLTVEVSSDGASALSALSAGSFSLVLMDCQMPVMDGFTATQRARSSGHTLPIIALTADSTEEARDAALAAGMDGYIAKPISLEMLYSTLRTHLAASEP